MFNENLTYAIRGAAFEVFNQLGHGFLEAVYQKALLEELRLQGVSVECEVHLPVYYKNIEVGIYRADLIVEGQVLIELKAQRDLPAIAEAQVINYLKATGLRVGLLINFCQPNVFIKRLVF